ncbi:hypothetical protein BKA67DRAFT_589954 [Truncatella angustata]|uniref:ML-like domain-containing protein n=1 Tax=Truncatella angustata TaxID=152316 RepID=A0A9P8UZ53_9PEZI|nr:uncharacterized protein BKA67DRAFT_589954 [Truncatella angustata]KAH6660569.1 hypothetical protein BKA67DRAFT_589954 [Truncatella angustata]
MARTSTKWSNRRAAVLATMFAVGVLGDNILTTSSFSNCDTNTSISVNNVEISYNQNNQTVTFDVSGTSSKVQNVSATMKVTAYGQDVYTNSFNPCETSTYVEQLCPVPAGTFGARGSQAIPSEYADKIPAIAFSVPDIAAAAKLTLTSLDDGSEVGCVTSQVTNGKTASVAAVSYIMAGVAGVALIASGVAALGSAVGAGAGAGAGGAAPSPSFGEVIGVFQGFAINSMHSVNYPQVYRSFAKNFAFSTGIIPWASLERSIDSFRNVTGGNLTEASFDYLQNATLVYSDGSTSTPDKTLFKRTMDEFALTIRELETSIDTSATTTDNSTSTESTLRTAVSGIEGYVEQLAVPQANTYMTVLLIVAILIAVIIVGILLVKVILETWALFGSFPKSWTGFRKHYWGSITRAITHLILILYGVWVLISLYQFTKGDSWAAKTLAGVTLGLFTALLAFFAYKIWSTARKLKNAEGDAHGLYDDKSIWVKYSLFYESYKKDYWWIFVPVILYLFAKGCALAILDGKGMAQTIAQIVIETLMLGLLLWARPFERKSSNWVNISIQVVRVLSVVCVLIFVEELGISQTTQTVAGVVLIAIQAALAGILAILIAWNAISSCIKVNPHRKRRKEMEKMQRDMDTLTPLDARNSLLLDHVKTKEGASSTTFSLADNIQESKQPLTRGQSPERYPGSTLEPSNPYSMATYNRPLTPSQPFGADQSGDRLLGGAAPMARQPTVPSVTGYGYNGYRQPGGY